MSLYKVTVRIKHRVDTVFVDAKSALDASVIVYKQGLNIVSLIKIKRGGK